MTKEEILAMQPGRKLDRLVKQHIFNVDLSEFHWERTGKSMCKETDAGVTWIDIPNYSEDISAAWEVVEKLSREQVERSFVLEFHYSLYWASFGQVPTFPDRRELGFKYAPESICKAALMAVLP